MELILGVIMITLSTCLFRRRMLELLEMYCFVYVAILVSAFIFSSILFLCGVSVV